MTHFIYDGESIVKKHYQSLTRLKGYRLDFVLNFLFIIRVEEPRTRKLYLGKKGSSLKRNKQNKTRKRFTVFGQGVKQNPVCHLF